MPPSGFTFASSFITLLQQEAAGQGFLLDRLEPVVGTNPAALVRSERGTFQISSHSTGGYLLCIQAPDSVTLATGPADDLAALVAAMKRWQDGALLGELQAEWSELPLVPDRIGSEFDRPIETAWRLTLERSRGIRLGSARVAEAAYAQPRLRALFPFPTHGTLKFLQPHSLSSGDRAPFIAGSGSDFPVYTGGYELLGRAETPEEAAALVVANLPEDYGNAAEASVSGPVSQSTRHCS